MRDYTVVFDNTVTEASREVKIADMPTNYVNEALRHCAVCSCLAEHNGVPAEDFRDRLQLELEIRVLENRL